MNFHEMKLSETLILALDEMHIVNPTEIQEKAIPEILATNKHVMAQAKTGTGKTLAFSIPIAEQLNPNSKAVQAIIMVPTRELCKQVNGVISDLTKYHKLNAVEIYGGVSMERQIQQIHRGAQIVVATPGRLIDMYKRREITFREVKFVVLDEADRMLDMGFFPDIEYILLHAMNEVKPRLFLFSATLLEQIKDLVKNFTRGQEILEINVSHDELTVEKCDQIYYLIDDFKDKYYHFVRIFRQEKPKHSLIFVNTKRTAEWLYNRLQNERGLDLKIEYIQGDLTQKQRELVLEEFRAQKINALIATDVAARGLDIPKVSHVFNYDIPEFEENYVHRIGRTSRVQSMGNGQGCETAEGTAISLVLKDEFNLLCRIEGFMKKDIKQRPLPPRSAEGSDLPPDRSRSSPRNDSRSPSSRDGPSSRGDPRSSPSRGREPRPGGSGRGSYGKKTSHPKKREGKAPDPRMFLY